MEPISIENRRPKLSRSWFAIHRSCSYSFWGVDRWVLGLPEPLFETDLDDRLGDRRVDRDAVPLWLLFDDASAVFAGDFAVVDAYPNRTLHRYGYRGEWTPNPDDYVTPNLEPLAARSGRDAGRRVDCRGSRTVSPGAAVGTQYVRIGCPGEQMIAASSD
jgi:hypothetical protein